MSAAVPALVAGVDGCPGGWLVVVRPLDDPAAAVAMIVPAFAEVIAGLEGQGPWPLRGRLAAIAVDIPIGLPRAGTIGGRAADREARAGLGGRQSAVFAVPARAAVMETDYRRACDVALGHSEPPRKVSKQTFYLFPKIREVDRLLTPELQARVVECHPEVAFWGINGCRALEEPKKVKSRAYPPGLALRRRLLAVEGYREALLNTPFPVSKAGADDLLDAVACSWTAARLARGVARRFPERAEVDARGLRMEIVW